MNWVKLWVFQMLGVGFAGRRRVLRAMRRFVEAGIERPFKPHGQFTFRERLAMAFFCTFIRAPLAVILFPIVFLTAGTAHAMRALGFIA